MVGPLLFKIVTSQIPFHAIDDFDIEFFRCFSRIRISLHHTMVGDGNGRPAPAVGSLDEVFYRYHGIHGTHRGMGMKFYTLDLGMVFALLRFFFRQRIHKDHILVHIGIKAHRTLDADGHALFELAHDFIEVFFLTIAAFARLKEFLAGNAIGFIRQTESQHLGAGLEFDGLEAGAGTFTDKAFEDDVLRLSFELGNKFALAHNIAPKDGIAGALHHHRTGKIFPPGSRCFLRLGFRFRRFC